jgi:oxalate decarboxylase
MPSKAIAPELASVKEIAVSNQTPEHFGDPRIPAQLDTATPHVFRIADAEALNFDGGSIRQASEDNFPILVGQQASIAMLDLEPGCIREPHWHPSAWEANIVVKGTAKWTVLEPLGYSRQFEATVGDVVFAPQGALHYFENVGSDTLTLIIVFNASTIESRDDVGIASSISAVPPDVMAALFGVPVATFADLPVVRGSTPIVRRRT